MLTYKPYPVATERKLPARVVTFSEVIENIFRMMYRRNAYVTYGNQTITVTNRETNRPLAEIWEPQDYKPGDFGRLQSFACLAEVFTRYDRGELSFAYVQGWAEHYGKNRSAPQIGEIPKGDVAARIVCLLGWLVGQKLTDEIQKDEDITSLVRRFKIELDR